MRDANCRLWTEAIERSGVLSPATKLTMLALARKMKRDGFVTRPRAELAAAVGRSERTVARHLQQAFEAGLLRQTGAGYEGHTATYQGTIPTPGEGQQRRPHHRSEGDNFGTLSAHQRVTVPSTLSTPSEGDNSVTPSSKTSASVSERVAVDSTASGETTTTAAASMSTAAAHPRPSRVATPPGSPGARASEKDAMTRRASTRPDSATVAERDLPLRPPTLRAVDATHEPNRRRPSTPADGVTMATLDSTTYQGARESDDIDAATAILLAAGLVHPDRTRYLVSDTQRKA